MQLLPAVVLSSFLAALFCVATSQAPADNAAKVNGGNIAAVAGNDTNATTSTIAPPTASTTTVAPNASTTATTPTAAPSSTTQPPAPTTPNSTVTTTTVNPVTPNATSTTPTPLTPNITSTTVAAITSTVAPRHDRSFDGMSFIGGMILALGIVAIGVVTLKFYRSRGETSSYFTL